MKGNMTIFGIHDNGWNKKPLAITEADRLRHVYIIGRTGTGKSTLIENLILQDIYQGTGCAFFDPHGSSAEALLERIPKNRTRDVIYFNPKDLERPFGINLLADVEPDTEHIVAQGVVSAFQNIWADSWGPRMDRIFYNAVSALLDYGHGTLLGVLRLLIDPVYRKYVLSFVKDPIIKQFWQKEYPRYPDRLRQEAIAPVQNKVERFISNALMRNIFGQKKNTLDFDSIINNRKIFIANLSKAEIGELNSNLIGSLLTTVIQLTAMKRIQLPKEERAHFAFFIDEFHSFSTESFQSILSESRKFGLSFCVGHQFMAQLDKSSKGLKSAILGNAGTLVAFRLGGEDAEELEQEFTPWGREELADTDNFEAFIKPLIGGTVYEPFRIKTYPSISPKTKKTGEIRKKRIINISRDNYGTPRMKVQAKIKRWMENDHPSRPTQKVEKVAREIESKAPHTLKENIQKPIPPPPTIKNHDLDNRGLDRRLAILSHLYEYGLLDSWQLQILDGGSPEWLTRILKSLTDDEYIIRPAGTRPHYQDGNNHTVYALGNKGADVLEFELGIPRRKPSGEKINFTGKYKDISQTHFKHSLLVNDLRVLLENEQNHNEEFIFINEDTFIKPKPRAKKTWYVPISHNSEIIDVGITPDYIFHLRNSYSGQSMNYFYEADCGTETINPKKDQPVSIYKKMLAYYYTHKLKVHTQIWNISNFRVPIVTLSTQRIRHMIEANKVFNNGKGSELFFFTTKDELRRETRIGHQTWVNGVDEIVKIL